VAYLRDADPGVGNEPNLGSIPIARSTMVPGARVSEILGHGKCGRVSPRRGPWRWKRAESWKYSNSTIDHGARGQSLGETRPRKVWSRIAETRTLALETSRILEVF